MLQYLKMNLPKLIENIHYYIDKETGLLTFTELYLTERNYCCKNGCRHCPYGYKKTSSGKINDNKNKSKETENEPTN
ncbi:MAG TPA: DUF5522 domain-containing protein [Chitinophagales bacterium]|nr:DUF5522 domain-containing protein [Chitinophagales bacterium]